MAIDMVGCDSDWDVGNGRCPGARRWNSGADEKFGRGALRRMG